MSDKAWKQLHSLDQKLRETYPRGMRDSIDVVIRKMTGFELFNTRPYHNYETWSDGYEASDGEFYVRAEDLDDCINKLTELKTGARKAESWDRVTPDMAHSMGFIEKDDGR